ncbi:MAG: hypothetical protein ACRCVT_02010 [Leadbetterella sp.]
MTILQLWTKIKFVYFSGSLAFEYEVATDKSWEEIKSVFLEESKRKQHNDIGIYISKTSIFLEKEQKFSSLFVISHNDNNNEKEIVNADISYDNGLITILTYVSMGDLLDERAQMSKIFIFFLTLVGLPVLIYASVKMNSNKELYIFMSVISIFNLMFWFSAYYLKKQSDSLYEFALKTVSD